MDLIDIRSRWDDIQGSGRPRELRVAVLCTFTADPLVPYLGIALDDLGLPADVLVGPYDQIAQECLTDDSTTARFNPHVLVVWLRLEDQWGGQPWAHGQEAAPHVQHALSQLAIAASAARRWGASLLFVLPAIPEIRPLGVGDGSTMGGVAATAAAIREALRTRIAADGHFCFDLEDAIRRTGARSAYNGRLDAIAHIPYSEELFQESAARLARLIRCTRRPAAKLLVLDADNTLWGGVLGELGVDGIDLGANGAGAAFRGFQSFVRELRRMGMLLALVSKNDERDVWEAFARREMVLKREDLAAWRIGWSKKSQSIHEIAAELGLGLDSIVFIDDNPAELSEVSAVLPRVGCIRMPEEAIGWWEAIDEAGLLDRLAPTSEDLARADSYEHERSRKELLAQASSPEEYLASLGIKVGVFAPAPGDLKRLGQLVSKTNQFNLNGMRRTDAELATLCSDEQRYTVRLVTASDRVGDYGIVGAYILAFEQGRATIDTFVLSCRALSRGVEESMIASMFDLVRERGVEEILAQPEELPRNEPARRFFGQIGCARTAVPSRVQQIAWPAYVARAQVQGDSAPSAASGNAVHLGEGVAGRLRG